MPNVSETVPLPERLSLEQLRKRAKDLRRAVRSELPTALALVARHAPEHRDDPGGFTLDAAQLVIARLHGFSSWPRLRRHLAARAQGPETRRSHGARTVEDFYSLRYGWADTADLWRCAAAATPAHPDPVDWVPLLSARQGGVTVIAFDSPAGVLFAELTPRRITLSSPAAGPAGDERAAVTFHTGHGTIAGVVAPGVTRLILKRPADRRPPSRALVTGGVFVAPNAFLVDERGLLLRVDAGPQDETVSASALPPRQDAVVDRPAPAAEGDAELTALLTAADAPPIADPDQWRPGVLADLGLHERVRIGRYGKLLVWHTTGDRADVQDPFVFDFTPGPGPVQDFMVVGEHLAFTRMYYGFVDGVSHTVAVVGLIDEARVASVVLRRDGMPDLAARVAGGTFLIAAPDLADLRERGPAPATVVGRDHAGRVCEELPYRQGSGGGKRK